MAKLFLNFEQKMLKEFTLAEGLVSIGRLPDNLIQVDNLAVSGHHAKIYWDTDHYVLEDNNSLNGTYVNKQKVQKVPLKDGDEILIGKHTLVFKDEWHEDTTGRTTQPQAVLPKVEKLEATVVLDTKKAKEMMAAAVAAKAAAAPPAATAAPGAPPAAHVPAPAEAAPPVKERIGTLTVLSGKTDEQSYVLSGRLTVIGKDAMASVKLRGWFAPKVAAQITRRDGKYYIAPSGKGGKVLVNGAMIEGQSELIEGDVIDVAGVKLNFSYQD